MPIRLAAPVLSVDAGKMHQIDTSNVENLFSMWTVFNRCAESMEEGRRLENLSWRLWNRETFCCESKPKFPDTPTSQTPTPRPQSRKSVPELSASLDSIASEDYERALSRRSHSPPVHIKGLSSGKSSVDSFSSSRGRAKPISSLTLEKMVMSIKESKDMTCLPQSVTAALPPPSIQLEPAPVQSRLHKETTSGSPRRQSNQRASHSSTSTVLTSSPASGVMRSHTQGSDTSAELITSHSIVRGFGPNRISSCQRTPSSLMSSHSPVPIQSALRTTMTTPRGANFLLGGSSDDESSFDDKGSYRPSQSSLTTALRHPTAAKKMTSFKEEVESRTIANRTNADEDAIGSSDEEDDDDEDDDDVSESAIEDEEDSSDWEDDGTESVEASPQDKEPVFKRVPSRPNLVSRRSLLTTMVHESERAAALASQASKSQPALQRLRTSSKSKSSQEDSILDTQGSDVPRSKPIVMATPTSQAHNALSPRTTRRNMLATELTESLRKHLLWERQQKNSTAQAILKRRHTAQGDLTKQESHAQPGSEESKDKSDGVPWNYDHGLGEYHSRGW